MRVFLTGATGYVGSAVAEGLLRAGHEVVGLTRSEESLESLEERGVRARAGSIEDPGLIARLAAECEAVIHAAAPTEDPAAAEEALLRGVRESFRQSEVPFVYTSGGWVMGETPAGETATEESSLRPPPALSWRPEVERRVLAEEGLRTVVVRPALVYGKVGDPSGSVVDDLLQWARAAGGTARFVTKPDPDEDHLWTMVHREDLGDFYARLLQRLRAKAPLSAALDGQVFLCTSGEPVRVEEVARAVSRAVSQEAGGEARPWPLDEARRELGEYADSLALSQRLSDAKARRMLGWQPGSPTVFDELAAISS